MSSIGKFGEEVPGYRIPVLNEREIRAAAGLLFVLLKYAIAIFPPDMLIRVFVSPRYSPTLILGRLIVRNQVPEYVGARQKKFAWVIGVALASVMFLLVNVKNTYGPITGIVCLVFLFCEAAFGICIGCKVYGLVVGEKAEHCPGEVCEPNARQAIQRTTPAQLLIVLGMVAYVVLVVMLFQARFAVPARPLFGG